MDGSYQLLLQFWFVIVLRLLVREGSAHVPCRPFSILCSSASLGSIDSILAPYLGADSRANFPLENT